MSGTTDLNRPVDFGSPEEEYRAFSTGAALVDRTHRSRLVVRGGDRRAFLQRLVSNDVNALSEGQGCAALLLMPKGQVISELNVFDRGEEFLVEYPAATRAEIFKKLTMYVLSSDVEVEDATDTLSQFGLYGPTADAVISGFGAGLPGPELFSSSAAEIAGAEVTLLRADPLGVRGLEILVARDSAARLWDLLSSAGESGVRPVGTRAAEWRRIVSGRPRHGAEIGPDVLPPELPLIGERAVCYTKGCFVGQETVARIKTYGRVTRELRGLRIAGAVAPAPGAAVFAGEVVAGTVTSSCTPPVLGFPIALAFVKRKHFEPGTEIEVAVGDGRAKAIVVPAGKWE